MSGGSSHDRRIRRRDPRAVAARILNRASEGGAFDDLMGEHLANAPWLLAYGDEVRARARAMVGTVEDLDFWREWEFGREKKRIAFIVGGFDGEEGDR